MEVFKVNNTAHRKNHIFRSDKKTLIIAMDHGANFDVLPELKHPGKMIRDIAKAGADAFLTTPGMASNFADEFMGRGILLRVDGGVSHLGNTSESCQWVVTAEDALRLGADSIITICSPGSKFENEVISNLSRAIMDAHRWGLPITVEALPRGFEKSDDSRTPENITFACRQSVEFGADMIKTIYTGDKESFRNLTESVFAPVVICGGTKKVSENELLQEIRDALDSGGAGAAIGRNIWSHETPVKFAAAIAKLIHEDCSVEQAQKEMNPIF